MVKYFPSTDEKDNDGNGIRHVQKDCARCNICTESDDGSQIQEAEKNIEDEAEHDGPNRHVEA